MKRTFTILGAAMLTITVISGCVSQRKETESAEKKNNQPTHVQETGQTDNITNSIVLSENIIELTDGLSAVRHSGDYGFDKFLAQGGASSDAGVVSFLMDNNMADFGKLLFGGNPFGCSTLAVKDENGNSLFGRNFDWNTCHAMIIQNLPEHGYASISTVNMDFITVSGISLSSLPDEIQALAGLYAPLDGVNEMGLAVSVNMIQDSDTIEQDTDKPDLTTTTTVRLLLDQAANVEEAVDLLSRYDLRASFGYMVHFAIADKEGGSVVVEYVNNEMIVTETPAVTNFYLAEGEKNGIGTRQSHQRYEILMDSRNESGTMNMDELRDVMDSVSKDNFGEFESTEWSIVMNLTTGEVRYYHRENYDTVYIFTVTGGWENI